MSHATLRGSTELATHRLSPPTSAAGTPLKIGSWLESSGGMEEETAPPRITVYERRSSKEEQIRWLRAQSNDVSETIAYNVLKCFSNPLKGKRPRILKLTDVGIENCKAKTGLPSSVRAYSSVTTVNLKNIDTIAITYDDGNHQYVYESPQALEISQEIVCRAAIRRTVARHRVLVEEEIEKEELRPRSRPVNIRRSARSQPGNIIHEELFNHVMKILTMKDSLENQAITRYVNKFDVIMRNPKMATTNCRSFMDGIKNNFEKQHMDQFCQLQSRLAESLPNQNSLIDLETVIERAIQQLIIQPLQDKLIQCTKHTTRETDEIIQAKVATLSKYPQEVFGVPTGLASLQINWQRAVTHMDNVTKRNLLPIDRIAAIVKASEMIAEIMKSNADDPMSFVPADEFLPIMIYVLCQSRLTEMETLCEYLYSTCDAETLAGEYGYYLTTFVSAVSYIKKVDPAEFGEREEDRKRGMKKAASDYSLSQKLERLTMTRVKPSRTLGESVKAEPVVIKF
ncbi:hypothetical protein PROFUN_00814 [Planoprotostelium fungivorum]|uniref:VPS9 domain-containing protein n=1 Tax=Planoprotostelium fungivorum TaxID=1890364 RepID=A0A2P6P033_9EUKA|nr:hypothetical protein PROFUN_00814 [Planoprotostelium fungivorum]